MNILSKNNFLVSITLSFSTQLFATMPLDYTSSVKVNRIEINKPVPADQIENLLGKSTQKIAKTYSECTGNYEYSSKFPSGKDFKFEIFAEDNPQVKSENFYKTKSNFKELAATKGRVWITWNTTQTLTERVLVNNKPITNLYTLTQFKKDFPNSAKNGDTSVFILSTPEVKQYLKKPTDFEVGYTSFVRFSFKNEKLSKLEINQGIAC